MWENLTKWNDLVCEYYKQNINRDIFLEARKLSQNSQDKETLLSLHRHKRHALETYSNVHPIMIKIANHKTGGLAQQKTQYTWCFWE